MIFKTLLLNLYAIPLEPEPKNTTAAITVGALFSVKINQLGPLLILPSDHYIKNNKDFENLMKNTYKSNIENKLICFGIKPTSPEIKYGYILKQKTLEKKTLFIKIKTFEEKPNITKAKNLIKNNALWNSGMFFFYAKAIIDEVKLYYPNFFAK